MNRAILLVVGLVCSVAMLSANGIGTWRLILPKQAYTMRTNPKNPNKLYVGNWANQVFLSNDHGTTWTVSTPGTQTNPNYLSSLHICSSDTATVLVGGYLFPGIKRSTNSCQDWSQSLQDPSGRQSWFVSEAISEAVDGKIYAARGRTSSIIYRTTDNGETWDSIAHIPSSVTSRLCTIATHPTDPNLIFLGAKSGKILRSSDGGQTFSPVPVVDGKDTVRDDSEIPKIVFSPNNPDRGYAIVAIALEEAIPGNGGVLATTDRGLTWNRIAFSDTSFWAVDVRKTSSGVDDILVGGFRVSTSDPVIKGDSLVFRSLDGGKTWEQYHNIQWKTNEIGDTIRNIWSFFRDTTSNEQYMATQVGLYILDETIDVRDDENRQARAKLFARFDNSQVVVHDQAPYITDKTWQLYDMSANIVGSGVITGPDMHLNVSQVSSGSYLLVWGSDAAFRTVPIQIVR